MNDKEKVKEYADYAPPADILENEAGLKMYLDIPGVSADNLSVDVEDKILKISADTGIERCGKTIRYKRAFQISDEIDITKIAAKVQNGILELDLPKAESAKVHRIQIAAG
jgi:HSP20 family molecular chaperone IbpA